MSKKKSRGCIMDHDGCKIYLDIHQKHISFSSYIESSGINYRVKGNASPILDTVDGEPVQVLQCFIRMHINDADGDRSMGAWQTVPNSYQQLIIGTDTPPGEVGRFEDDVQALRAIRAVLRKHWYSKGVCGLFSEAMSKITIAISGYIEELSRKAKEPSAILNDGRLNEYLSKVAYQPIIGIDKNGDPIYNPIDISAFASSPEAELETASEAELENGPETKRRWMVSNDGGFNFVVTDKVEEGCYERIVVIDENGNSVSNLKGKTDSGKDVIYRERVDEPVAEEEYDSNAFFDEVTEDLSRVVDNLGKKFSWKIEAWEKDVYYHHSTAKKLKATLEEYGIPVKNISIPVYNMGITVYSGEGGRYGQGLHTLNMCAADARNLANNTHSAHFPSFIKFAYSVTPRYAQKYNIATSQRPDMHYTMMLDPSTKTLKIYDGYSDNAELIADGLRGMDEFFTAARIHAEKVCESFLCKNIDMINKRGRKDIVQSDIKWDVVPANG